MTTIDLTKCLGSKSDVLVGYVYGQKVRREFDLDAMDAAGERVTVVLPQRLDVIAPSFAQGFFGESVLRLGQEGFYKKYDFSAWSDDMFLQVETGVLRALMERDAVVAA